MELYSVKLKLIDVITVKPEGVLVYEIRSGREENYLGIFWMKKKQVLTNQYGFTLIELMITVAIVGILATVAYPAYTQYLIRANRAAAQAEMMDIANQQQQYLLTNRNYASKTALEASGYALPSNVNSKYSYAIVIGTGAVPSYTLTFTPSGAQTSDGNLVITNEGVKTPADKW